MKYFITINQQVLSETNLDIVDGAILDYIYFYCNSQNNKVKSQRIIETQENNEIWTWINYQSLLIDMPMLKINSISTISFRIDKIEKAGYIKTKRFKHQKKYFQMTTQSDELFVQTNRAIHSNEQTAIRSDELIKNKDIYKEKKIKVAGKPADNSQLAVKITNNPLSAEKNKQIAEIIGCFQKNNPALKYDNKTERKAALELIAEYSFEKVKEEAEYAVNIQGKQYAPVITTPGKLWKKFPELQSYKMRSNNPFKKGFTPKNLYNTADKSKYAGIGQKINSNI